MFKQFRLNLYEKYSNFQKVNDRGILRVPFESILTSPAVELSFLNCLYEHRPEVKQKFGLGMMNDISARKLYLETILNKLDSVDFDYFQKAGNTFDSKQHNRIYFGKISFFNPNSFSNIFINNFSQKAIAFWIAYLERAKVMKEDLSYKIISRNFDLPNGQNNKGLYFFLSLKTTKEYEKGDFCPACNSMHDLTKHHIIPSAFFQDIKKKYNMSLSKNRKYNVVNFCNSCHAFYESNIINFSLQSRPAIADLFVLAARFSVINSLFRTIKALDYSGDNALAKDIIASLFESIDHEELLISQKLGIQFTDF